MKINSFLNLTCDTSKFISIQDMDTEVIYYRGIIEDMPRELDDKKITEWHYFSDIINGELINGIELCIYVSGYELGELMESLRK